jgi:hypothetical protein
MSQIPVKDHDKWFRDEHSGSINCSDTSVYNQYMKGYRAEQRKEKDFGSLQNEVSELKSEMSEIKALLLQLANTKERT